MDKRDLHLWKYGISTERYRELHHFCRQYPEWKEKINYGLSAINYDGMPHGSSVGSATESQAIKNGKYIDNMNLIESTCIDADVEIWVYLLKNVTEGKTYEELNVPKGRRQFYDSRRKFFYMLDLKRP